MGNSTTCCSCGDRALDTSLEDGKAIATYAKTLTFPEGVAGEKLDEAELDLANTGEPAVPKAVQMLLEAREGALDSFKELLKQITLLPRCDGKLDEDAVALAVKDTVDNSLSALKFDVQLCSVSQAITEAKGEEKSPIVHYKWLTVVDRDLAPKYKAAHVKEPPQQLKSYLPDKATAEKKGCVMM
eukprot:TRINITY_DN49855_c0_g1_i1.p1 TRINITY_DN49855_c0_g1~~TRINITY_DN49855_c0_g1_i1.p1  ORF type:complete len:185 (+),score=51.04 TRINITY_DN49855_c0_g1_i1:68-622(+)